MNNIMPLAFIAVPYLPWLIAIWGRLPRYSRALQSVDYNTGRYIDWWLKNAAELRFLLSAVIVIPIIIVITNYLIDHWRQDSFYLVLFIANFIFALTLLSFAPRHKTLQSLKNTSRTSRLTIIAGIISILLPLIMILSYAANLNDPFWDVTFWSTNTFRYVVNAICAALFYAVPLAALIANLINFA